MQSQPKSKRRRGNTEADAAFAALPRNPHAERDAAFAALPRNPHAEPDAAPARRRAEVTPAGRALRLLARREHTRRELEQKLAPHVEDAAEIQRVLDDFTARGWLSEARAAEQLVRAKRGRYGAARIGRTLADKGVPPDLIASSLEALKDSEVDTARTIWARKFKTPPSTPAERARHVRFLQSRGFSLDLAMRVVRGGGSGDAGDS